MNEVKTTEQRHKIEKAIRKNAGDVVYTKTQLYVIEYILVLTVLIKIPSLYRRVDLRFDLLLLSFYVKPTF